MSTKQSRYQYIKNRNERELGKMLPPVDMNRRLKAKEDWVFALKTYFPRAYKLDFSIDHYRVIQETKDRIVNGGFKALAMPRGSGKTTIVQHCGILGIIFGFRRFILIVQSNGDMAKESMKSISTELIQNEILRDDFPEVCFPFYESEGQPKRAESQRQFSELTGIAIRSDRIVFPYTKDYAGVVSVSGDSMISCGGFGKGVRGMVATDRNGNRIRPDFILFDDVQDDKLANNADLCIQAVELIDSKFLNCVEPDKSVSSLFLCTPKKNRDLNSLILDNEFSPKWSGERFPMLKKFPKHYDSLWQEYFKLRKTRQAVSSLGGSENEFYLSNKDRLDEGCVVYWNDRYDMNKEYSAIQSAMNKVCDLGMVSFSSEFQCQPISDFDNTRYKLTPSMVSKKIVKRDKGEIPDDASCLVAFSDVNLHAGLHWVVCAFTLDMKCYVVDYGKTSDVFGYDGKKEDEGKIVSSCVYRLSEYMFRDKIYKWQKDKKSGKRKQIDLMMFDAGFMTSVVQDACYHATMQFGNIRPSLGRANHNYRTPTTNIKKWDNVHENKEQQVIFNSDYYKEIAQRSWFLSINETASASIFESYDHIDFALQLCSEELVDIDHRGKRIWETHGANHYLDAFVGCWVCASMCGCKRLDFRTGNMENHVCVPKKAKYLEL